MTIIDVTQLWCDRSGVQPGDDNSTHYLEPKGPSGGRSMTCRYCGRTEKQLREGTEKLLDAVNNFPSDLGR